MGSRGDPVVFLADVAFGGMPAAARIGAGATAEYQARLAVLRGRRSGRLLRVSADLPRRQGAHRGHGSAATADDRSICSRITESIEQWVAVNVV